MTMRVRVPSTVMPALGCRVRRSLVCVRIELIRLTCSGLTITSCVFLCKWCPSREVNIGRVLSGPVFTIRTMLVPTIELKSRALVDLFKARPKLQLAGER